MSDTTQRQHTTYANSLIANPISDSLTHVSERVFGLFECVFYIII